MMPNLPTGETMSDGSGLPPEMNELMAPAAPAEQAVALAALQQPDDSEQLVTPEPGDLVSYTVEGTVSRVEGDKAFVTVETINGQPVAESAPEAPQDELGALRAEAEGMMI